MNYTALIPMIICFILCYLFFSLLFSKHRNEQKLGFLIILITCFIWNFLTLLEWWPGQNRQAAYIIIYLKIFAINILLSQSLNSLYIMIRKKRNAVFWFFQAYFFLVCLANLILPALGIPLLEKVNPALMGFSPQLNFVYIVLYSVFCAFFVFEVSRVTYLAYKRTPYAIIRRQLQLVGIGLLITLLPLFLIWLITDLILKIRGLPVINSILAVSSVLFAYIAISHYQFLTPGILTEVNKFFSLLNDSVIILDHEAQIVSMNQSAGKLFQITGNNFEKHSIKALIGRGYAYDAVYIDVPLTLGNEQQRRFLMSQFSLFTSGILQGKVIFLKDVTHLTETEARVRELNAVLRSRAEASNEELQKANLKILQQQYKEEMANFTTLTLHNVRNILSTIRISSEMIINFFSSVTIQGLKKANDLLRKNKDNLEYFLLHDEKGKLLFEYYMRLDEGLEKEKKQALAEFQHLENGISNADQIIAIQQGYGRMDSQEKIIPQDIIEDALNIVSATIRKNKIEVYKNYQLLPLINVQKAKFIHILLNLIKNAIEAMEEIPEEKRILTVVTEKRDDKIMIRIKDQGKGISAADKERLFTIGYTTKEKGNGYGLYSCLLYIREMQGSLEVENPGEGQGAEFLITLPCR